MSTYAVYNVWVGVTMEDAGSLDKGFVERVEEGIDGIEIDGLTFFSIAMHGDSVGIGVKVCELDWTCEIEDRNVFDLDLCAKARKTLLAVNKFFRKQGVQNVKAKVYHHIDLGG